MKIIFLDFDGVITTCNSKWNIDLDKLSLLDKIIQQTDAKIVVTSSWKHGCKNVEDFKEKIHTRRCAKNAKEQTPFAKFVDQIYDITDGCGYRGDEVETYLNNHKEEIESYVILDDDDDFKEEQLFNFVQTDTYEGITEREVKLCISILNNIKIPNPIRLNLRLTTMWRNKRLGIQENNIDILLQQYHNKFLYNYDTRTRSKRNRLCNFWR
jgi:hypothetical protein